MTPAMSRPVAIIDIGSNSVRLVVYEGLTRAPTPIFNEKVMCGLGREVAVTGRLDEAAANRALRALARFRILCRTMGVAQPRVVATAAARDAHNGPAFIAAATEACGAPIELLSGDREAYLSALGVRSGFHDPDGVVGDLGGGSLELIDVRGAALGQGVSLPLGGLALQARSGGDLKGAERIVREALEGAGPIDAMRGRIFYAVGGTWRALARLHMRQTGYPLDVMHAYTLPPRAVTEFARMVERVDADSIEAIGQISAARRPLIGYGALVLEQIIKRGRPSAVVIAATGVREGLLFELLDEGTRALDPLIDAAATLNTLRSRSPRHGEELTAWTGAFMASAGLPETPDDERLRHGACLLADIGWRAHPDYRGEQTLGVISHATFVGIDHPGRAALALSVYYRHVGLSDDQLSPRIRELATPRLIERARLLGGLMRVAYLVSASMPGVLPRAPLLREGNAVRLRLPEDLAPLASERLRNRLKQLGKLLGYEAGITSA